MSSSLKLNELEGFEWNRGNIEHIKKHDVSILECEEIFLNRPTVNEDIRHSTEKELRFQALGQTNKDRKLFVSFTIRGDKIRVISARDQSQKERKEYEKF